MLRPIAMLFSLAVALASLASAAAPSNTVPHRESAGGILVNLQPGVMDFEGLGVASHFGRYAIVGRHEFDAEGNVLNGTFTTTAADGSTISGVYAGTYTPLPSGQVRFDVQAAWLSGTGRLEGVTGEGNVVAFLDDISPGARFEYETIGTLVFP